MKGATPRGIVNGALKVAVPYAFHRDRIVEPKSAGVLAAAIRETYGADAKVEVEIESQTPVAGGNDVWQQALQSFGGKLSEKGGFDA
ncbi:MAG: hypothetical protein HY976_02310 [Candidatus Kerfeldbacteria bacterium]|nr:hypothetical protein [Candidatus Kerfeldbacteria bacterium]